MPITGRQFLEALTPLIEDHGPDEFYFLIDLLDDASTVGLDEAAELYRECVAGRKLDPKRESDEATT